MVLKALRSDDGHKRCPLLYRYEYMHFFFVCSLIFWPFSSLPLPRSSTFKVNIIETKYFRKRHTIYWWNRNSYKSKWKSKESVVFLRERERDPEPDISFAWWHFELNGVRFGGDVVFLVNETPINKRQSDEKPELFNSVFDYVRGMARALAVWVTTHNLFVKSFN